MKKEMMTRNPNMFLTILMTFALTQSVWAASEKPISSIAVEAETGLVLHEENADIVRPPASMIKLMAMLLVSEGIDEGRWTLEQPIIASRKAQHMGGTQVYLEAGDSHTLEQLMQAVSVASANDATMAVAEGLWGSEEAYLEAMNVRAAELGMSSSEFHSVHGLPPDRGEEFDKTTARDMALLGRACARHERIMAWTNLRSIQFREGEPRKYTTNKLMRRRDDMDGMKTGYIRAAGFCITATLKKDGVRVISVVMGHPDKMERFRLAERLLDEGVANVRSGTLVLGGLEDGISVEVANCEIEEISLAVAEPIVATTLREDWDRIEVVWEHPKTLTAPIKKGAKVGVVKAMLGDTVLGETDITVTEALAEASWLWKVEKSVRDWLDGD
ncbi:MAG: D-alanyl-D-alanine carboxypeptidase family protein [Candidatus Hydrogenedentota bacterium]